MIFLLQVSRYEAAHIQGIISYVEVNNFEIFRSKARVPVRGTFYPPVVLVRTRLNPARWLLGARLRKVSALKRLRGWKANTSLATGTSDHFREVMS